MTGAELLFDALFGSIARVLESIPGRGGRRRTLVTIKTYPTQFEADAARIALEAADIPCVVVGVGVSMEGGIGGVQLQVHPDQVEAALEILQES